MKSADDDSHDENKNNKKNMRVTKHNENYAHDKNMKTMK